MKCQHEGIARSPWVLAAPVGRADPDALDESHQVYAELIRAHNGLSLGATGQVGITTSYPLLVTPVIVLDMWVVEYVKV